MSIETDEEMRLIVLIKIQICFFVQRRALPHIHVIDSLVKEMLKVEIIQQAEQVTQVSLVFTQKAIFFSNKKSFQIFGIPTKKIIKLSWNTYDFFN